jgi:hypothetical protein
MHFTAFFNTFVFVLMEKNLAYDDINEVQQHNMEKIPVFLEKNAVLIEKKLSIASVILRPSA